MHCLHRKYRSKSTSYVDEKTSLSKFFPQKKPLIVTHQSSSSSRASDSIITYSVPQQRSIQSFCNIDIWNSEITSKILSLCDLQLILTLRLVSKIFHLTSTVATDRPSSLATHAIVLSSFFRLISNFSNDSDYKEKFEFAKQQNLEQHIVVSVNDIRYSPSTLSSIPKNKLNIILKIDLYPEILQLQNLIKRNIKKVYRFS